MAYTTTLLFAAYSAVVLVAVTPQCVNGLDSREMVDIGGKPYYISIEGVQATAKGAALLCNDIGMSLASFETSAEYAAVQMYIDANVTSLFYWTSGHVYDDEWIWTGSGKMFTDEVTWLPGEPNDETLCPCVYMRKGVTGLVDGLCTASMNFICE